MPAMSEITLSVPAEVLGERLRRARRAAGLSTSEMASELGIHRNMISRWENGRDQPKRMVLLAWAMRCGVPLEWLEHGEVDGLPTGRYDGIVWLEAAA
jgi:transcriptional regulator with XRE-family HTH domain